MSDESNALLALKHAWSSVVTTSGDVERLAPSVMAIDEAAPIATVDLDQYHRVLMAQSIAVMALRGLVEQLSKKYAQPVP
jgi:hypothetical protein